MDRSELVEAWKREEQQPFSGWDFSYLKGRMLEEHPAWSYPARGAELMRGASSVIDLDTGGAERFLELQGHWPERVVATENYPPNVELAAQRLLPLGAHVVNAPMTDRSLLPFADGAFDLVLNRHSAINAREVARILSPGGTFLTQQIHGLWAHDLSVVFDAEPQWPEATPEVNVPRLRAAGLDIVDTQEWSGRLSFVDVGAVVYYLRAVPWMVPGFSVETHLEYLLVLQHRIESGEGLDYLARKYLIEARKGGNHAWV
jgi:SAM-dependent methyltransferase